MKVTDYRFQKWMDSVLMLLQKRGIDTADLDEAFYRSLYRDDLDPEEAVQEDLCLSV